MIATAELPLVTPRRRAVEAPIFYVPRSFLPDDVQHMIRHFDPNTDLGAYIKRLSALKEIDAAYRGELVELVTRSLVVQTNISGIRYDGRSKMYEFLGILSDKVITTAGVNWLVDAFQNLVEPEDMCYHGFGSGTTAEAVGQTALVTEFTTQYVGDVRPTGSRTEGATPNVYRSVASFAPDSGGALTVQEHGLFSANAAGTMWDRSLTGPVTVDSAQGDSLQITHDTTFSAGG